MIIDVEVWIIKTIYSLFKSDLAVQMFTVNVRSHERRDVKQLINDMISFHLFLAFENLSHCQE